MTRISLLALLALLIACPGRYEPGYNPNQPPDQNSLGFAYVGEKTAVAGQWRVVWGIQTSPSVNAPGRFRFQGPGTLTDYQMQPIDFSKEYLSGGGLYLPPSSVPPEGATVKLGCEVLSPITQRWEKSPDYEIKVSRKTTPMDFFFWVTVPEPGDVNSATVRAGNSFLFGLTARPRPAVDLQMQSFLVPPDGFSGDAGSLRVEPMLDDITWRYTFTAPSTVAGPMDVIVRTTAFDPWVQQTRTINFTIRLVP